MLIRCTSHRPILTRGLETDEECENREEMEVHPTSRQLTHFCTSLSTVPPTSY
jgi:hypothetical protein